MVSRSEVFNFSPGPAAMPESVMQQVAAEFLNYRDSGVSLVEMSHRGVHMKEIAERLFANLRQVLAVPDDYEIVLSAGGGQGQFAAIPLNLLADHGSAAYLVSGHWSRKAFQEGQRYTNAVCAADAGDLNHNAVQPVSEWTIPDDAAYLYCCDNETVHGLMLPEAPDVDVPVVCDMTSSLLAKPVDWSRYDLVMAGCQKNIAPAGMTVVIVKKSLLERQPHAFTPNILNYQKLASSGSMPNTPATFSWYFANLVCEWVIEQGGVDEMQRRSLMKSALLYDYIDQSDFYSNDVDPAYRSSINVCFNLADESRLDAFLQGAAEQGLLSLKGHRAVGGLRANLYNALPLEGVQKLVKFMDEFA